MPYSADTLKARESICEDLKKMKFSALIDMGLLNDNFSSKYFTLIKNNDQFNKLLNELYLKNDFSVINTAVGTFMINSHQYEPQNINPENQSKQSFQVKEQECKICLEECPDYQTVLSLILDASSINQEFAVLEFYQGDTILIVNNYISLLRFFQEIEKESVVGVDLEGRLRYNGNINLIQIGTSNLIYIFDIYQVIKLSQDHQLLEMITLALKYLFQNKSIRKVFFDGRRDLEALHFILGVGAQNVFDVQIAHMIYSQFVDHEKQAKKTTLQVK